MASSEKGSFFAIQAFNLRPIKIQINNKIFIEFGSLNFLGTGLY